MELVVLDGGVASAMKNTQFAVIAGVVLLVVGALNTLAGCMNLLQIAGACFRCCRFCCRFCWRSVVAVMLQWVLPPKPEMVNKRVQSQTTYTLKSTAPRFKPLAEWETGVWDD